MTLQTENQRSDCTLRHSTRYFDCILQHLLYILEGKHTGRSKSTGRNSSAGKKRREKHKQLQHRSMAAELFPGIFPGLLLDVVDDEWAQDKLPNDDIPFPPGICPPADELDEANQEQIANLDKWNELGLHLLQ